MPPCFLLFMKNRNVTWFPFFILVLQICQEHMMLRASQWTRTTSVVVPSTYVIEHVIEYVCFLGSISQNSLRLESAAVSIVSPLTSTPTEISSFVKNFNKFYIEHNFSFRLLIMAGLKLFICITVIIYEFYNTTATLP